MQPQPSHLRAATHPPPRPYAQRPVRQFTPLGMTLTRAFEKLRDAGLTVPLALRPLPHPIPLHFRSQALLTSSDSGAWYWALCDTPSCDTRLYRFRVGQLVWAKCDHQSPAYTFYTCSSSSSKFSVDWFRCWWYWLSYGILGYSRLRTWSNWHGYITFQQFSSDHFSFWLWSSSKSFFRFVESSF